MHNTYPKLSPATKWRPTRKNWGQRETSWSFWSFTWLSVFLFSTENTESNAQPTAFLSADKSSSPTADLPTKFHRQGSTTQTHKYCKITKSRVTCKIYGDEKEKNQKCWLATVSLKLANNRKSWKSFVTNDSSWSGYEAISGDKNKFHGRIKHHKDTAEHKKKKKKIKANRARAPKFLEFKVK